MLKSFKFRACRNVYSHHAIALVFILFLDSRMRNIFSPRFIHDQAEILFRIFSLKRTMLLIFCFLKMFLKTVSSL
jgi:hypothetical protein